VAGLLGLPLDVFAGADHMLEFRVPWHRATLWLVPDEGAVQGLEAEGVSRGRIWTAQEVTDLLSVSGIAREAARMVALAKMGFDGEVTEVRPWARLLAGGHDRSVSEPATCSTCRGEAWWRGTTGLRVCRRCHPPALGTEASP
jgi:hypothetical protein